jgi:hypothetical protein
MLTTPPAARLLVLVPDGDLPVVELAQHIWALAAEAGSAVLLVGLPDRPEHEPQTRRALLVLQNHTRFEPVLVSTRIAHASNWLEAVKQVRRPGDCVVCFANQQAPAGTWGLRHQPLAEALQSRLHMCAHVFGDPRLPAGRRAGHLYQAAGLAFSLALIAAFFVLQAWIQSAVSGGAATALLLLSIVVEFGLLAWCQGGSRRM